MVHTIFLKVFNRLSLKTQPTTLFYPYQLLEDFAVTVGPFPFNPALQRKAGKSHQQGSQEGSHTIRRPDHNKKAVNQRDSRPFIRGFVLLLTCSHPR